MIGKPVPIRKDINLLLKPVESDPHRSVYILRVQLIGIFEQNFAFMANANRRIQDRISDVGISRTRQLARPVSLHLPLDF